MTFPSGLLGRGGPLETPLDLIGGGKLHGTRGAMQRLKPIGRAVPQDMASAAAQTAVIKGYRDQAPNAGLIRQETKNENT